ncbi:hypothetical protein JL721_9743 [Aureococcus anophagefferens]|nr:hypothetical protein JL721_9743 [Aureococcus anophagefferens]
MAGGAMLWRLPRPEFEDETIQEVPPEASGAGPRDRARGQPGPRAVAASTAAGSACGCAVPGRTTPRPTCPGPRASTYGSFKKADEPARVTEDWHVAPDPDGDEHGWSWRRLRATGHGAAARPAYRRQIWHRFVRRPCGPTRSSTARSAASPAS